MTRAPRQLLSASLGLRIKPQSCTATIFLTVTMPVSESTSTSAIVTPPTPLLVRSGGALRSGFLPRTVSGIAPSFEHASFQLSERLGSDFTRILPFTDSSSSGCAFKVGATLAKSASRASIAALRVDELTPPGVDEPPEPPDAG